MQRQSHRLGVRDLREFLDALADKVVFLLEISYELVRGLLTHDASDEHLPPRLPCGIAAVEWSGKKHHADGGKQNMPVCAALLGGSIDGLGMLTTARRPYV